MVAESEPLFGIWKGEQDSNALRAFMAALKLHSTHWHWAPNARSARWWVIDDVGGTDTHEATTALYGKLAQKPRVAFLSRQMVRLPVPGWTFFKVPLETQQLFHWLDAQFRDMESEQARPRADWAGSMILLTRWPNMARYGTQLELVLACSKLLAGWTAYDELLGTPGVSREQLDTLLQEARDNGILQQSRTPTPAHATGRSRHPGRSAMEGRRTGLIRRLLDRFAFK